MAAIKFISNNTQFFPVLRKRVNQYFEEKGIPQTGNYKLYIKTALLSAGLIGTYLWLVFFTPHSILLGLLLCGILGVLVAAVGFNVMHDGAHGSYSNISWLNNVMAYSLNVLGGSSFMWKHKHNIAHHSFTNIEGMDEDIDIKPFLRVNTSQKRYWFHRFQHIYGLILYGFTYLMWIFFNDFKKYFSRKVTDHTALPPMNLREHLTFWLTKFAYAVTFFILPVWQVGLLKTLLGYGMLVFITGILIAIVFQLAHVHEEAAFVEPQGEPFVIENDWAIHQINTTANFATKQKWHSWFWGGLNYQIEHHLFPRISHVHYPEISKIVKQTCREFNIAYNEFPTVIHAIHSHFTHLKKLGVAY
ncbi:MAG TPA: acyl-CoA desaturase [Saprospiraceae bacterium]|nr:acyl-CoA desaturase [Saprospiraceae bacterium]HNT18892.1 acyl-CoA desaturase [Saprospiraceae bacterium]